MRVSQLIDVLSKLDQDAQVRVEVGWAKDTAISDPGTCSVLEVSQRRGDVIVSGWFSNCGTELEVEPDEG